MFAIVKGGKYGVRGRCKLCDLEMREAVKKDPIKLEVRRSYNRKSRARGNKTDPDYMKEWRRKNPEKLLEYGRKRRKDPIKKLRLNMSTRIWLVLKSKGKAKNKKTLEVLGTDIDFFKSYLEEKFDVNMNWNNYGSYWHVDHIIPLDSGKTEEEIYRLCHYTNLQPLEAKENIRKKNKLP